MNALLGLVPTLAMAAGWPLITIREAYGPIRAPERTREVLDLHARHPDGRTAPLPIRDGRLTLPALPAMGIVWIAF